MKADQRTVVSRKKDRRGYALLLVVIVLSVLLSVAGAFLLSITEDYAASRQFHNAGKANQYAITGMIRAMAELQHDVWGVDESVAFRERGLTENAYSYNNQPIGTPRASFYYADDTYPRILYHGTGVNSRGETWAAPPFGFVARTMAQTTWEEVQDHRPGRVARLAPELEPQWQRDTLRGNVVFGMPPGKWKEGDPQDHRLDAPIYDDTPLNPWDARDGVTNKASRFTDPFLPEGRDYGDVWEYGIFVRGHFDQDGDGLPDPVMEGDIPQSVYNPDFDNAGEDNTFMLGDSVWRGTEIPEFDIRSHDFFLWPSGRPGEARPEGLHFIRDDLVGDSFYMIFRNREEWKNQVNNNVAQEWYSYRRVGAPAAREYHFNDSKWIYIYDRENPSQKVGRYAVYVWPDCGYYNINAFIKDAVDFRDVPRLWADRDAQGRLYSPDAGLDLDEKATRGEYEMGDVSEQRGPIYGNLLEMIDVGARIDGFMGSRERPETIGFWEVYNRAGLYHEWPRAGNLRALWGKGIRDCRPAPGPCRSHGPPPPGRSPSGAPGCTRRRSSRRSTSGCWRRGPCPGRGSPGRSPPCRRPRPRPGRRTCPR